MYYFPMSFSPEKLASLGIELPKPVKPQGVYVPAVRVGNTVHVSGQLPMVDGALLYKGMVGRDLSIEEAAKAARLCFINTLAALTSLKIPLENVARVVQLQGFVQCGPDFYEHPQVINGASNLAAELFGELGQHSRFAVGAVSLPLNSAVEIASIFQLSE